MNIDLDQIKQRIQESAEAAADEGETVEVSLSPRNDVPASECEVAWIKRDHLRVWTGYAGPLDQLENAVMVQIGAHAAKRDREHS